MKTIQNPHAQRLLDSLTNHCEKDLAEEIVGLVHLPKGPNETKKAQWVQSVLGALESHFDEKTMQEIRMDCACGPSPARMKEMKELYDASKDLEDFARRADEKHKDFSMWVEEGALFFSYPSCYCSMVKHNNELLPKSWCFCTLGYTKRMFEFALNRQVEVELLESIKQGNKRCVMRVS